MSKIKSICKKNKYVASLTLYFYNLFLQKKLYRFTIRKLKVAKEKQRKPVVFFIGVPAHTNLGDLAQYICIKRWIQEHYPDYPVIEMANRAFADTHFPVINRLKKAYRSEDIILFQSGYATTDLSLADEVHRIIISEMPEARILMLPQTVFYTTEAAQEKASVIYNSAANMLFLARDQVSYEIAKRMMPDVTVLAFPDIVTTLIGTHLNQNKREGILFCCRNDKEKFYSDEEMAVLMEKCKTMGRVDKTDTTKAGDPTEIVANAETMIHNEINDYSKYRVIITDRYHGTIFALIAGTPVIILKTTDHKVVTGADWFQKIYNEYVYVADTLDHAYQLASQVVKKDLDHFVQLNYKQEYYDKLPNLFENFIGSV